MTKEYNDQKELEKLEEQIKQAEKNNQPIDKFVLREIEILQNTIDLFMEQMKAQDRLDDFNVAEIEIRQYAAMRQLAQKINHPYEIYDEKIKQIQIRIFGEENYENFFGEE